MTVKVTIPPWLRVWATQPVEPVVDNRVDMTWLDKATPLAAESGFVPSDAQARLARVETMLADHARSEGRTPYGSVEQQLAEVLDRLHEQSKQDI